MSFRCPEAERRRARLGRFAALPLAASAFAALGLAALLASPATFASPGASPSPAAAGALRVCADPNAMPFSNAAREGFENKIAELLAADLGEALEYTWWAQRRGFVRNTIRAGACDVLMNVPVDFDPVATTR